MTIDMSQWGISRRINTISRSLMIGLVLVALVGIFATFRLSGLFEVYRLDTQRVTLVNGIAEDIYAAERSERAYRRTPTDAIAAGVEESLDRVREQEQALEESLADYPDMLNLVMKMRADVEAYSSGFVEVQARQADRERAIERMAAAGPALRSEINRLLTIMSFDRNARAEAGLRTMMEEKLLSRIYAERYLLTNMAEDIAAAEQHYLSSKQAMENAVGALQGDRKEIAERLLAQLVDYWDSVLDGVAAIEARNETRALLDGLGEALRADVGGIVEGVTGNQESLAETIATKRIVLGVLLVAFSGLTLAASWAIARRISRDTESAIARSIGQMQDLSRGNLEVEITGTDDRNEMGDMARALAVFRDNALETRALEARQREQEEQARRRELEAAERRKAEEAEAAAAIETARRRMLAELKASVGDVVGAGARGDFSRRIDAAFDEPELSEMAQSINTLVESVETGIAEVVRVMDDLAAGKLSGRMTGNFQGAFAALQANVNETFDRLSGLVSEISGQCDDVGDAAASMSDQAVELAKRAEQQAASLEETSAAMEEISASARSSAEGATNAEKIALRASESVDKAGGVVASAVNAMGGIRAASEKINDIVGVIDGIAFQTNLLALNASVEAARAGSAGKGFAVVATEVRSLAQRAGEASKDIKKLIDESAEQVGRGVGLVEETGKTLETIMTGVSEMTETMRSLSTTAKEQATGVGEVTTTITQLDAITQKNAQLSDQTRHMAAEVGEKAEAMRKLLGWFRTEGAPAARIAAE